MAVVSIESGSGSSGGFREGSARDDNGYSLSSVSSHFAEDAIGSCGADPEVPVSIGNRIFHGVPLFLLKGGVRVVGSPFEPDGQGTMVSEWAPHDPSLYASSYAFRKELEWRVCRTHIVRDVEDSRLIRAGVTLLNERVFHDGRSSPYDFFFMTLFRPFSDSFKKFKQHYFKIIIDKAGLHEFSDGEGRSLFPFYWTRDPRRIQATSIGALTAPDLEAVFTINALPRRISARHLVECLSLEDCGPKAFELMTTPGPRKSNFMATRKKSGASSSTARPTTVPNVPRPPPAGTPTVRLTSKVGVPPADKTGGSGMKVPGSSPPPELAAVQVDPTSEAAATSADPLTRKRKDHAAEGRKDKEGSSSRSASKKARKGKDKEKDRERVLAVPLLGDVFSPKMSTRTSALAWYLRKFADRPRVAEVRAELDREKKNSASLQLTLEQMVLNQDEYDKKIEQLEADLEKAKREAAEGLAAAWGEQKRMAEEGRQLKAEVARLKETEAERTKANEVLTLEVTKAKEQIAELESTIMFEHEEGVDTKFRLGK
ncbi:hypothetical protein LR48_Vigan09g167100 [Vigna angularis]|uniref:Uncharacterized protein n=1 Tax=Phaseolus angularis TaxID=3914 RepID=A0A0L9VDM5_PHAAN|nr:hypothetical protein LR48_Vigan09g167100 [Vigna angularis]